MAELREIGVDPEAAATRDEEVEGGGNEDNEEETWQDVGIPSTSTAKLKNTITSSSNAPKAVAETSGAEMVELERGEVDEGEELVLDKNVNDEVSAKRSPSREMDYVRVKVSRIASIALFLFHFYVIISWF